MVTRTPLRQAGFFFTLHTLSRQVPHRVVLASSLAVGLSLILITARGPVTTIPLSILAGQSLLLASVLSGFRHAVRIPADLRASTTFSLAWTGNLTPYLSGVKLAGWIALVLPTLGALFIWHAILLGTSLAALHFGVGVLVSSLFMETAFFHTRRVPFVTTEMPTIDVKLRVFGGLVMLLSVSFALAWVERWSFTTPWGYIALLTVLAGLSLVVASVSRTSGAARTLDLDEQPLLPTQRLNLAE